MGTIVDMMVEEVRRNTLEKNIDMIVSREEKDALVEKGYSPKFGARPLRKKIQQYVEDELAERYLKGELVNGSSVLVDFQNGSFVFNIRN